MYNLQLHILYCTALCCIVSQFLACYCFALLCISLHCNVLHVIISTCNRLPIKSLGIVLHYIIWQLFTIYIHSLGVFNATK